MNYASGYKFIQCFIHKSRENSKIGKFILVQLHEKTDFLEFLLIFFLK